MQKWNWEMDTKTKNIYKNLEKQINKTFKHCRQGSFETRHRYSDGMRHFAKFLAETYHKQNLNRIENKHLEGYTEQMREAGYSNSYITTNISGIRFFIDQTKRDSSYIKSNKELGVMARNKEERIGRDRSWTQNQYQSTYKIAQFEEPRIANMMQLAKEHGLRVHEITRLDRADLQRAIKHNYITVKGKGGLVRQVPVQNHGHIKELIKQTPVGHKVFVEQGEKTHQVIEKVQRFIYANRGNDKISFHGLRHTWAQTRYEELKVVGKSDFEARKQVSKELGHFRVEITEIYLSKGGN